MAWRRALSRAGKAAARPLLGCFSALVAAASPACLKEDRESSVRRLRVPACFCVAIDRESCHLGVTDMQDELPGENSLRSTSDLQ